MRTIAIGGPDPIFTRSLVRLVAPTTATTPATPEWRRRDGPVVYAMEVVRHQTMMRRVRSLHDAAHLVTAAARHTEDHQPPVIVYLQDALSSRDGEEAWPTRGVIIVGSVVDLESALQAQNVPCASPWPTSRPAPPPLPAVTCRHRTLPRALARREALAADAVLWRLTLGRYGSYRTEVGLWRQTDCCVRAEWVIRHPDLAEQMVRGWHDPSAIWSDGVDAAGRELLRNNGPERWPALAVALSIHLGRQASERDAGLDFHRRVRWALDRAGYQQAAPQRPSSARDPALHELFLWAGRSRREEATALPPADQERLRWWSEEGVHLVAQREHDIFNHLPRQTLARCLDSLGLLAPEIAEAPHPGPCEDPMRLLAEAEAEAREAKWVLSVEHESRLTECLGYLGDLGDRAADAALAEWMQNWTGGTRFGKKIGRLVQEWPTLSPSLVVGIHAVLGRGEPEAVSPLLIDRVPVEEITPAFQTLVEAHHGSELGWGDRARSGMVED